MNKKRILSFTSLAIALAPAAAMAHVGTATTGGFAAGFTHTLGGADHLLAMLGIGLWAAFMGGRSLWAVPAAFLLTMLAGGVLAIAGLALPMVEAGILASLLIVGLLVAGTLRLPLFASMSIAAGVALLHGHAHGTEMPLALNAASYGLGFTLSAALLLAVGAAAGLALKAFSATTAYRVAGAAIAAAGLGFAAG
jgi:urease accessory protein